MAQASKKRSASKSRVKQRVAASKKATGKKASAKKTTGKAKPRRAAANQATAARKKAVGSGPSTPFAPPGARNSAAVSHLAGALREVAGIAAILGALIFSLALFTFNANDPGWSHTGRNSVVENSVGPAGAWLSDVFFNLFGFMAYLIPMILAWYGWRMLRGRRRKVSDNEPFAFVRIVGFVFLLVAACGLADLHLDVAEGSLPHSTFGGGILGTQTAWKLVSVFKPLGTTLLLLALFFSSLTLSLGASWMQVLDDMGGFVLNLFNGLAYRASRVGDWFSEMGKRRTLARARQERLHQLDMERWQKEADREAAMDELVDADDGIVGDPLIDPLDATARSGFRAAIAEQAAELDATQVMNITGSNSTLDITQKIKRRKAQAAGTGSAALADAANEPPLLTNAVLKAAKTAGGQAKTATPASSGKAAARKKPAIKQRAREEKQYALFRDVPDSDLPPLSLLDPPQQRKMGYTDAELESLSRLLEVKLADFKISVEVVAVHPGPVITRFELQPEPGTKARQITNLTQDIARSLSLVSVRVVEVIAGKSTIGLEIPNEEREIVQLSEMLQSEQYDDAKSPLTLALGKNISGVPVTADLGRMPHLLVAGTTGAGKSVAVNAMLMSLLYKATPKEVRLILVDPKMLELNIYDGIPHLLTPVVTDMKEASNALRWCVGEMERRYKVMASLGVRNLAGYNKKVIEAIEKGEPIVDPLYKAEESLNPTAAPPTLEPFPLIVVVVDEFADMIMQVGKKAEELIARIAQKARAAGIHLILATQRPSVDVITGLIKANIPSRIAFQVSSRVDSRTILDQMGAESLLGHGDMLYLPPGVAIPERVHGAFVDDHEVHNVVAHIKASGEPNYLEEILQETGSLPGIAADPGDADSEQDALYDQAVAVVTESRKASISYVQRRLKIGYNRAARMVEDMEAAGVVSEVQSNGTREVLAPPPVSV